MNTFLSIKSRNDLASFLGIDWSTKLAVMLYAGKISRHYRMFEIPKHSGGSRAIAAPSKALYGLQKQLLEPLSEIYRPPFATNGFVRTRGIIRNAIAHVGSERILTIDIENFFPSINFGRVRGLLMSKPFLFPSDVASCIAHICCLEGSLPQGAPTSPIISNMLCRNLDKRLFEIAKRRGCIYTRYADDMTFSGKTRAIERLVDNRSGDLSPNSEISHEIASAGFSLNNKKTRILGGNSAMLVTGLVTNVRLNVRRKRIRRLRSFLHWIEKKGYPDANEHFQTLKKQGFISGARAHSLDLYLKGSLRHLMDVRGRYDPLVQQYQERFNRVTPYDFKFDLSPDPAALAQNCYVVESEIKIPGAAAGVKNFMPIQGTAFAISRRVFITCSHCIGTNTTLFLPNATGAPKRAWLVARCTDSDLAIIRTNNDLVGAGLSLSHGTKAKVGDEVTVYGFPRFSPGATIAINSAKIVQFYRHFGRERIRVSSPIVSGNSGGPVLNTESLVIGVAATGKSSFHDENDDNQYGVVMLDAIADLLKKNYATLRKSDPSFAIAIQDLFPLAARA